MICGLMLLLLHCSGGDGSGPSLTGSFTPSRTAPSAGEVVLQESTASGDLVTVDVMLTGINDVRTAEFGLLFDPAALEFVGDSPGSAFEAGGSPVIYVAAANISGVLTVAVDIAGPARSTSDRPNR